MSFSDDLKAYSKKTGLKMDKVAETVCADLSKSVIMNTPVDKGGARANWIASINTASNQTTDATDKSGSASIAKALTVAKKASGNIFYLTNNLPYIRKLEFGGYNSGPKIVGGFSIQAPSGMVRISMQKIKSGLKRI